MNVAICPGGCQYSTTHPTTIFTEIGWELFIWGIIIISQIMVACRKSINSSTPAPQRHHSPFTWNHRLNAMHSLYFMTKYPNISIESYGSSIYYLMEKMNLPNLNLRSFKQFSNNWINNFYNKGREGNTSLI